jgi:hypothetical protein
MMNEYYRQMAIDGIEGLFAELQKLQTEVDALKAPRVKRLTNGRVLETVTNIVETRDMFGNVATEKRTQRKYRDEMTAGEKRIAAIQHCSRVQEGLAKRLKREACGDNVAWVTH